MLPIITKASVMARLGVEVVDSTLVQVGLGLVELVGLVGLTATESNDVVIMSCRHGFSTTMGRLTLCNEKVTTTVYSHAVCAQLL